MNRKLITVAALSVLAVAAHAQGVNRPAVEAEAVAAAHAPNANVNPSSRPLAYNSTADRAAVEAGAVAAAHAPNANVNPSSRVNSRL